MKKLYLLSFGLMASLFFVQAARNSVDKTAKNTAYATDSVKIIFQVDMSNVTVSEAGVHMNGSWGNWGSAVKMYKMGSVYSATLLLHPGDTILYKFVNGAAYDWSSYENPIGNCSASWDYNNRILIVPPLYQELKPVLYNECALSPGADSIFYTFQVDMSKTLVSDSGVWMNGSWGNWGKPVRMQANGSIYKTSLKLHIGDSIAYKFVNGGQFEWSKYETPIGPCTVYGGSDRILWVPNVDVVHPPICFNECMECMPDSVYVTFMVNMKEVAVSDSGVHLNGSWSNWSKPLPLKKEGTLYSGQVKLHTGDQIKYKFMNGGPSQSSSYENPLGGCSDSSEYNNRVFWVPPFDYKLEPVCFNQCSDCTPDSVSIGFLVNMSRVAASDSGVYMNGSWSNWSKPVRMEPKDIFYATFITLHPGDTIQYKYMNGSPDNWRNYENPQGSCADTLNFNNRTFIVPPYAMILDPVCFDLCQICHTKDSVNVTFRVDMSKTAVSDSGVWVNGAWSWWMKPEPLKFDGKFYAATVRMHSGDSITYKFVNGGRFDWMKYENPKGTCTIGGAFDRMLYVPGEDLVLDPVCYDECTLCLAPEKVRITFQVDMKNTVPSDSGVFVNGAWCGWSNPVHMTYDGKRYFKATVEMHPGDSVTYKFVNGGRFDWMKYENPQGTCTIGGAFDRMLWVPKNDLLLEPVCYNECSPCMNDSVDITFMVNMSKVAVSDSGVYMNGSWGKWGSPIKLVNLSSIYFGTLKMHPGDTLQYKFVNGNPSNWNAYENPSGSCADAIDFNNRILIVPNDNKMIGPFCYGECTICVGSTDVSIFDEWNYYGADQLPTEEHWTQTNTGLGYKPSNLQIVSDNNMNNILTCFSDSLHLSQVTFGSTPTITGPFTMVVRAKSDVSDGHTLGGYFEINPGISFPNVMLKLHCDGTGNRFVSLSDEDGGFYTFPIDIREWHTYWLTFDADSLRLFIDAIPIPVLTATLKYQYYLENVLPFTIRMLSTAQDKTVTGSLDFISWKLGGAISPEKFLAIKLQEPKATDGILAHPNPTNGMIRLTGLPDENVAITLYDGTGKLLNTFGSKNVRSFDLNLTDKTKGMYLLRVQTTQGAKTFKILRN